MKTILPLVFGAAFAVWGIHGAVTGAITVPVRKGFFSFGSMMKRIHRSEEPARFWTAVGLLWILGGALLLNTLSLALTGRPIIRPGG